MTAAHSLAHLYSTPANFLTPKLLTSLLPNRHRVRAVSRRITEILKDTCQKTKSEPDPLSDVLQQNYLPDFTHLSKIKKDKNRLRTATRLANRIEQAAQLQNPAPAPSEDSQQDDDDDALNAFLQSAELPDFNSFPPLSAIPDPAPNLAPPVQQPFVHRPAFRVRNHTEFHPTGFQPTTWASCGLVDGPFSLGPMNDACHNCNALHFRGERRSKDVHLPLGMATFHFCCNHGKIKHKPISHPFPEEIKLILKRQKPPVILINPIQNMSNTESREINEHMRHINGRHAFASMTSKTVNMGQGVYAFKVQGTLVHKISNVQHRPGTTQAYSQLYFTDEAEHLRQSLKHPLCANFSPFVKKQMETIHRVLRRDNPFAQAYKLLKDIVAEQGGERCLANVKLVFNHKKELDLRRYNAAVLGSNEVAAIITGAFHEKKDKRCLFVSLQNETGLFTTIPVMDPNADPMCYPIFFPRGDVGYHRDLPPRDACYAQTYVPFKPPRQRRRQAGPNFFDDEAEEDNGEDSDQQADEANPDPEAEKTKYYSMREHYSYLFSYRPEIDAPQIPPLVDHSDDDCEAQPSPDQHQEPQGNFSSIHHGGRLTQQYFVDAFARVEEHACNQIRRPTMQKKLKAEMYIRLRQDLANAAARMPGHVEPGRAAVLPATFIGSPRYMHQAYNKAMAISMHAGAPHKFITATANPKWPEVVQNLLPGQTVEDRPDLLARVFKLKLDELLKDLIQREIFGEIGGYAWTIEYQKRGMPHVHILLIQKHKADMPMTGKHIDLIVSAEIPDKRIDTALYEAVKRNMIHGPCGNFNTQAPCMLHDCSKGMCKRYYPKPYAAETLFDVDGFPQYMRRQGQQAINKLGKYENLTSEWVVPYNPYLLLKYDCHINVEIATSIKSFKYLYKYIYKGGDKAEFKLRTIKENEEAVSFLDSDEVKDFQDARYLSSHESCWRMFGFPTNSMSHCVESLQVHLPNQQEVLFQEGTANLVAQAPAPETTLTAYFKICAGGVGISATATAMARTLLYHDMPLYFTFNSKSKTWKLRSRLLPAKVPWHYQGSRPVIGRMHSVSPRDIERYCLRLLLLHIKGPQSYDALKLHNNVQHRTFHEAAIARGLLADDREWHNCLTEANLTMMPYRLMSLFACILISCNPSDPFQLWEMHKMSMIKPDRHHRITDLQQLHWTYNKLDQMIQRHNSELSLQKTFQIPRPQTLPTGHRPAAPPQAPAAPATAGQNRLQTGADMYQQLNPDQRSAFDRIYDSQERRTKQCFFIDGPGGTGKSFMYKTLIKCLQEAGTSSVVVASTGIAATLLDGVTAHKGFKMPFIINHDTVSNMKAQSKEASVLKHADVII